MEGEVVMVCQERTRSDKGRRRHRAQATKSMNIDGAKYSITVSAASLAFGQFFLLREQDRIEPLIDFKRGSCVLPDAS